jgi:rod shape determining protein RodA
MSAGTTLVARDPRAPIGLAPGQSAAARRGRPVDWILLGAALSLALIGAVCVWSATRTTLIADGRDPQLYLFRHLLNIGIGAALLLGVMRLDAHLLRYTAAVSYAAALLGLLAVVGIGSTVNGAHAWIRIGAGFELQPSEFMKVGLIAGLAVLFGQRSIGRISQTPTSSDVCLALALMAVPLGLIMLQPDLGSAMVLSTAAFGVFIAAGVRARWTIGLLVAAVLGIVVAVKAGMLAQYQIERFTAFTHPGADTQGAAYNVTQAHIAIANGGLFGTGLFHGPQTRGAFVPEQQTDFVYSVAAEELGFIGAVAIIALFALLCWRGLKIAAAADRTGRLLAVGIICWFAFQSFQNIGMNLGLMPVTGLPLPFVSYGGSSMFAQALAIGLLQAVQRRSALSTE